MPSEDLDKCDETNNEHCVKGVCIWSYSGWYLPSFGLNTDRYEVSFRILSECGKMWTRIIPNTDTFNPVESKGESIQTVKI